MAEHRHRTLNQRSTLGGSYRSYPIGSWISVSAPVGTYKEMDDVVGNKDGVNPLLLRTSTMKPVFIDGELYSSVSGELIRRYENCPMDDSWETLPDPNTTFGSMSFNRLQALAWELMAAVNPSAPDVSIPQVIAEMKDWGDVPRQLQEVHNTRTRSLMRKYSTLTLLYEWGVKPFVSDVRKMCQFIDNVEKRRRLLDDLAAGKEIRRKRSLGSDSVSTPWVNKLIHSRTRWNIYADVRTVSTSKVWGSVSYKLSSTTSLPSSDRERLRIARNLVEGMTSWGAVELAWELLPWSWFADWFSSFGDSIKALNNTIPITWSKVCIMRDSTCRRERRITTKVPETITLSGEYIRTVRHQERFPVIAVFPFAMRMPVLTTRQWSILGSLSILKLAKS